MSHICIWKYRETDGSIMNYFDDGATSPATEINYIDRIVIYNVPANAFPQFDSSVESADGLLEYVSGDFDIRLSLLQTETSVNGDTIQEFLLPETSPNKFLISVYFNDNCHYSGTFVTTDITSELSFNKNDYYIKMHVTGILKEFAEAYSMGHRGTRLVGFNSTYSFEAYLNYHFDTRNYWSFEYAEPFYHIRVNDNTVRFNGQLQAAMDSHNGSGYWSSVSRWETFRELAKGFGFNYRLKMIEPQTAINLMHPAFRLQIVFIPDIVNQDAIDIAVLEHNEDNILLSKDYVYAGVRQHTDNGTLSTIWGVLFNENELISKDGTGFGGGDYFQIFNEGGQYTENPRSLFIYEGGRRVRELNLDNEITTLEYTLYGCPNFGSHISEGALAYSQLFNGSNLPYDHTPINNYLAECYKRFIVGSKKKKIFKIYFDGTQEIEPFRKITLSGIDYAIWGMDSINMQERTANVTVLEI